MWIEFNNNPVGRKVGDCAVRAVAKALDITWEEAYVRLMVNGFQMGDMPSSNSVWGSVLRQNGFSMKTLPDSCPDCYTAEDFCREWPVGTFVLGFGNHTCCVQNGNIYDAWDSSKEIIQYVWYKRNDIDKKEKEKDGVSQ